MISIETYVKKRDRALLSFDIVKIRTFFEKYKDLFEMPVPSKDEVLYASAMKAIIHIQTATPEQKARAEKWLKEHGFGVGLYL